MAWRGSRLCIGLKPAEDAWKGARKAPPHISTHSISCASNATPYHSCHDSGSFVFFSWSSRAGSPRLAQCVLPTVQEAAASSPATGNRSQSQSQSQQFSQNRDRRTLPYRAGKRHTGRHGGDGRIRRLVSGLGRESSVYSCVEMTVTKRRPSRYPRRRSSGWLGNVGPLRSPSAATGDESEPTATKAQVDASFSRGQLPVRCLALPS
ncbi:hypothetical protein IWZ00DRAFT_194563 [Phyllosticta capitalensis]